MEERYSNVKCRLGVGAMHVCIAHVKVPLSRVIQGIYESETADVKRETKYSKAHSAESKYEARGKRLWARI